MIFLLKIFSIFFNGLIKYQQNENGLESYQIISLHNYIVNTFHVFRENILSNLISFIFAFTSQKVNSFK